MVPVSDIAALAGNYGQVLTDHKNNERARQPFCFDIKLQASGGVFNINDADNGANIVEHIDLPLRDVTSQK